MENNASVAYSVCFHEKEVSLVPEELLQENINVEGVH